MDCKPLKSFAKEFDLCLGFNPIQDGSFRGCWWMGVGGGGQKCPLNKICHTYPATWQSYTLTEENPKNT